MGRIEKICSYLDVCNSFADVGCDHGYCTRYMLENGLCGGAVITDISDKSLDKARTLLKSYMDGGKCRAVCCDGLSMVDRNIGQVLIAGMGGEEIIKILKQSFIPRKFVLQPMKNAIKLRAFLLENGCKIIADDIFRDEKYYFIIKGESEGGTPRYSEKELAFGRDSLKNPLLKEYASDELAKKKSYLSRCTDECSKVRIIKEITMLSEVINDC